MVLLCTNHSDQSYLSVRVAICLRVVITAPRPDVSVACRVLEVEQPVARARAESVGKKHALEGTDDRSFA
jgi:hypothetical protein